MLVENADDLERLAVDGHRAPNERGGLRLEAFRNVGAEHDDSRALLVLGRREESAVRQLVVEDLGVGGRGADEPAVRVQVVELELAAALRLGHDGVEVAAVRDQRVDVVDDERLAVARHAAGEERATR